MGTAQEETHAGAGPIASWRLGGDGRAEGTGLDATPVGPVAFGRSTGSPAGGDVLRLRGEGRLEVGATALPALGDLTVSAWVNVPGTPTTVIGDLVSWFDPASRLGFTLGFEHGSPCGSHGNDRTAWFGIDAGSEPRILDHGRPGDATVMVCSLAAFDGSLFAATWETGPAPLGRVFRRSGGEWQDAGAPGPANAVTRLAVHDGALYAGTSRLKGGGSGLDDSANLAPGGHVYRLEPDGSWLDLGGPAGADSIAGLVPFGGDLYAIPMYTEGLFRFDGPGRWTSCGSPGRRLLALGAFAGALYGAGNDHAHVDSAIAMTKAGIVVPARSEAGGGGVFRYDGDGRWTGRGMQPDTTQLYSIETYGGRMHVGTWPTGLVFRADDPRGDGEVTWASLGRLGDETEVMNLQAYNGKLYAGTLPHAQLFRFDGDADWRLAATLDETPDVRYRRAASMVLFDGELYVGTLPSAHVHSLRAGAVATSDRSVTPRWHHLAGVRRGAAVTLFVDGRPAGTTGVPGLDGVVLEPRVPLAIGGGPRADFEGEIADVRLWSRALDDAEVATLAG